MRCEVDLGLIDFRSTPTDPQIFERGYFHEKCITPVDVPGLALLGSEVSSSPSFLVFRSF